MPGGEVQRIRFRSGMEEISYSKKLDLLVPQIAEVAIVLRIKESQISFVFVGEGREIWFRGQVRDLNRGDSFREKEM